MFNFNENISIYLFIFLRQNRPFEFERVDLPLCKVSDSPFHIKVDEMTVGDVINTLAF